MRNIILIVSLLVSNLIYAQYGWTPAVVSLNNGKTLTGEASIPMQNSGVGSIVKHKERVKFRLKKGSKKTKYDISEVSQIVFTISFTEKVDGEKIENSRTAKYVPVINKKRKKKVKKCFMEEIVVGPISLYGRTVNAQGAIGPMNQTGTNIPMYHNYWMTHNELYVQKENEEAKLINQISLFKGFKKRASKYFGDCPAVVVQLEERELKKKDLKEIVELYNSNCG